MTEQARSELDRLLIGWESGQLDESETQSLRDILRSDPDARTIFLKFQILSVSLMQESETHVSPTGIFDNSFAVDSPRKTAVVPSDEQRTRYRSTRDSWLFFLAASAAVLLCVTIGIAAVAVHGRGAPVVTESEGLANHSTASPDADVASGVAGKLPVEQTSRGLALVTELVDAKLKSPHQQLEVGDALPPGSLVLMSGFAQIEFFCGATVILEGPAEIDLSDWMSARVLQGRLRVSVPPAARGFTLEVDQAKVIDYGTEFGLSVTDAGACVQVFEGEVGLQETPESEKKMLRAGDIVIREQAGDDYERVNTAPDRLVDITSLQSRVRGQVDRRLERWRRWSAQLRQDERLVAYFAFDEPARWNRRLRSSIQPAKPQLDGAIGGAQRVRGRWPGKSGLEFKQPGDRVRVDIPGQFESLSFACWVKIDSLDRQYNSLFLTDNYNYGEPHWQILHTGELFFSVRRRPDQPTETERHSKPHYPVISPSFWKPAFNGRWLHLAVTFDAATGLVTHYVNGQQWFQESIPELFLVPDTRIGTASIGNWSLPTEQNAEFAIRNLNGSMDEFVIFSTALTNEEIVEMYEYGKP